MSLFPLGLKTMNRERNEPNPWKPSIAHGAIYSRTSTRFQRFSFSGTATMEITNAVFPVRGTNYDGADVCGLLTYGGVLKLSMTTLITGGTYNLFDFGSVTGNLSSVAFAGGAYAGIFAYDSGSGTWNATDTNGSGQSFSYSLASGDLTVTVPEPSTVLLSGLGLAAMLWRFRRARA